MRDKEAKGGIHITRRTLLKGGAGFALALGLDQGPQWTERLFNNQLATIGFVEGQRLKRPVESGVLVLPGLPGRSGESIAEALVPSLGLLGPVMYGKYGSNNFGVPTLENDLDKIQKATGMQELSVYFQSMALDVGAQLLPDIADKFDIDYVFADCFPEDFDDVHLMGIPGEVGQLLTDDPLYAGGAIPTAINEWVVYGNPLEGYLSDKAATPNLYWNELKDIRDGKRYVKQLASFVRNYNLTHEHEIKMVFLGPRNPAKDPFVEDVKSEKELSEEFPGIIDQTVGGNNQGHANPDKNKQGYNDALRGLILQNGI